MAEQDSKQQATASAGTLNDHLANERTFLAWVRTSIGIMAFGFVVERFSLFIKQVGAFLNSTSLSSLSTALNKKPVINLINHSFSFSAVIGIVFVAIGALVCLLAFLKFLKIEKQIKQGYFEPSGILDAALTAVIVLAGISLMIYLSYSI